MKLWYSPASPFVRKVMIVAHERELQDKIELVKVSTSVVAPNADLVEANPTGKIPTARLEDDSVLFDSRVICDYLDSIHGGKRLMPRSGSKRYEVMTLEALGDAIMDAAVNNRYEMALRPEEFQWQPWIDGQMGKVEAGLDQIEEKWLKSLGRVPNMGSISIAAAIGYLEFRYPDLKWRKNRKGLARWFKRFSQRPSYVATEPE